MLQSVIPDQISPEGKCKNLFQLASDAEKWEKKFDKYSSKLNGNQNKGTLREINKQDKDEIDNDKIDEE